MFTIEDQAFADKKQFYASILAQLKALIAGESDPIANMANCSSLLFYSMKDVNWAGFYILRENELVLGPFQGKPACIRIAMGKGVCGTAAMTQKTQCIDNVHEFPGHIPCDSASNSEIVIPVAAETGLIGVLDIDSPLFSRFDSDDINGLEALVEVLQTGTKFSTLI